MEHYTSADLYGRSAEEEELDGIFGTFYATDTR
jgi:hypothetical protein